MRHLLTGALTALTLSLLLGGVLWLPAAATTATEAAAQIDSANGPADTVAWGWGRYSHYRAPYYGGWGYGSYYRGYPAYGGYRSYYTPYYGGAGYGYGYGYTPYYGRYSWW